MSSIPLGALGFVPSWRTQGRLIGQAEFRDDPLEANRPQLYRTTPSTTAQECSLLPTGWTAANAFPSWCSYTSGVSEAVPTPKMQGGPGKVSTTNNGEIVKLELRVT